MRHVLRVIGPCLSSVLASELQKQGLSAAAARQRISRLRDSDVQRLNGLNFPKREAFLFLADDFGGERFVTNLISALERTRSVYSRPLRALLSRDGAINLAHLAAASGVPTTPTRGHVLFEHVQRKLLELGIIRKIDAADGPLIALTEVQGLSPKRKAVSLVEQIVLSIMATWLSKVCWSSLGAIKFRDERRAPPFGQFEWDLVGPCYLSAIAIRKADSILNGFVIGDILLGRTISRADLIPFFAKWQILRAQNRRTRFQPFFIAEDFDTDALNDLRREGCMISIPETMFGHEVAELLRTLVRTIEDAVHLLTTSSDKVFELLKRIAKVEGAAINLRGIFFELAVAHVQRVKGFNIELRIKVQGLNGETDIDVKATNVQEVVCCECKALAPGVLVSEDEIKKWEEKSLPLIKEWLQKSSSPETRSFEFYSATDFTPGAQERLKHLARTHLRQPIRFFNGRAFIKLLHEWKQASLVKAFREQFPEVHLDR